MSELANFYGPLIVGFALGLLLLLLIKGGEKLYVVKNRYQISDLRPLGWFEIPKLLTALFWIMWLALVAIGFILPWSESQMDELMLFIGAVPGGIFAQTIWHFYLRGR